MKLFESTLVNYWIRWDDDWECRRNNFRPSAAIIKTFPFVVPVPGMGRLLKSFLGPKGRKKPQFLLFSTRSQSPFVGWWLIKRDSRPLGIHFYDLSPIHNLQQRNAENFRSQVPCFCHFSQELLRGRNKMCFISWNSVFKKQNSNRRDLFQ